VLRLHNTSLLRGSPVPPSTLIARCRPLAHLVGVVAAPWRRSRNCLLPMVRVCRKPYLFNSEAVLFRLWQDRVTLILPDELEPGAVLAIQRDGTLHDLGAVLVGEVECVASGQDEGFFVRCRLRRPLSPELIARTATLFTTACERATQDYPPDLLD